MQKYQLREKSNEKAQYPCDSDNENEEEGEDQELSHEQEAELAKSKKVNPKTKKKHQVGQNFHKEVMKDLM